MIQRDDFNNHLSDYLRGVLSPDQQHEMETYIEKHLEVLAVMEALREILSLTEQGREELPPPRLLEQARARLLTQLEKMK